MNKRIISLLIVMIMIAAFASGCAGGNEDEAEVESFTSVQTKAAELGTIENSVTINGKVSASEEVSVMPKAMGTVTSLNVALGDQISEGDVLFTVEQKDMNLSVSQAANGVDIARKSVDQAANGLNSAKINYELNKEKIQNAQLNLERTRILYEEGAVSKSQLEQAELSASQLNLDALQSQVNQAQISYQQAQEQLQQAQISYQQAQSGLSNTVVLSPMTGIVSTLNVKEGQIAASGQPAATITNTDTVYVRINVVENIVNRLEEGQEVEIAVPAAFEGYVDSVIDYVSQTADPMNKLYEVRIYVNNAEYGIRSGMTGSVKLSIDKAEDTLVIDSNAVLDKDGRKIIYIVQENKAVEKEVKIGLDTGDQVQITSGLSQGDMVIVEGQHYVSDGVVVKVVRGE
ncbi:efflux RND transporter periplasmic adaptor subunit [Gudongella sp. DL1XJH-153]|uniref:efflux RND transporter periplasmic adaptor subunit n=1 Tax=Gudongella sp. DL1XJH-153 TaxID=3409804 RepID=UPI003BB62541